MASLSNEAASCSDFVGEAVWNKATIMGAECWPAHSDKGSPVVPVRSPCREVTANTDQRNAHTTRQRSFKKHGGGGSFQSLSSPTHSPSSQNTSGFHKRLESGNNFVTNSPRHNNVNRRGAENHQHGAKKDQDRPNRNFNNQGSFNGRNKEVHPQPTIGALHGGVVRYFPMQPAMYLSPLMSHAMRPYGPTGSYPEFPMYYIFVSPEEIRGMGMPYPAPAPHQMFMQYIHPELYSKVMKQIDYYFSHENLVKDIYLRNNMDEEGWVSIKLIAGFKQVQKLTNNIAFIMEAIKTSTVVELKDNKVRRQNDWSKWLMPASLKFPSSPTHHDSGSHGTIVAHIQKINLENADVPSTSSPLAADPSSPNQGYY